MMKATEKGARSSGLGTRDSYAKLETRNPPRETRNPPRETKVFTVDLAGVRSAAKMHARLAEALPLPEYYGCNLDAFHDVLTECGGSWKIVFENAGKVADGLRAVCADAMDETPGLEIVFED